MALIGSSSWGGGALDQSIGSASDDDDFGQFLTMEGMGNMEDRLSFDLHGFPSAGAVPTAAASHMLGQSMSATGTHGRPSQVPSSMTVAAGVAAAAADLVSHAQQQQQQQQAMAHHALSAQDELSQMDSQMQYLQRQRHQHLPQSQACTVSHHQHHQQQQPGPTLLTIAGVNHHHHHHHQGHQTHHHHHHRPVPPTPGSLEISPAVAASHFYAQADRQRQQQQQHMFDSQYHGMGDAHDTMTFTPLVSPAVTPLDSQFPMSENGFLVAGGAYFTPLASPALMAQTDSSPMFGPCRGATGVGSPAELVPLDPATLLPLSADRAEPSRQARRKSSSTSSAAVTKSRAKQTTRPSPMSKPQRRKAGSTASISARVLDELQQQQQQLSSSLLLDSTPISDKQQQQQQAHGEPSRAGSISTHPSAESMSASENNASVSPEPLMDMPPPPVPTWPGTWSPNMAAHAGQIDMIISPGKPAETPTSLMHLPNCGSEEDMHQSFGGLEAHTMEPIEVLELPESDGFPKERGQSRPPQSPQDPSRAQTRLCRKTILPAGSMASRPAATSSAVHSPALEPSPASASAGGAKRPAQMLAKGGGGGSGGSGGIASVSGSRKRASISAHVSPSLRPKISPNIKPLIPGTQGQSAEEEASRLLTTKSNYQNMVEGNTVPGVTYSTELSRNLTSKRTSHKLAEQGRRNRINTALQEMATLLPKSMTAGGESPSPLEFDGKMMIPSSKASTLELAIDYIKALRGQMEETNQRVDEFRQRAEQAEEMLAVHRKGEWAGQDEGGGSVGGGAG